MLLPLLLSCSVLLCFLLFFVFFVFVFILASSRTPFFFLLSVSLICVWLYYAVCSRSLRLLFLCFLCLRFSFLFRRSLLALFSSSLLSFFDFICSFLLLLRLRFFFVFCLFQVSSRICIILIVFFVADSWNNRIVRVDLNAGGIRLSLCLFLVAVPFSSLLLFSSFLFFLFLLFLCISSSILCCLLLLPLLRLVFLSGCFLLSCLFLVFSLSLFCCSFASSVLFIGTWHYFLFSFVPISLLVFRLFF